MREVLDSVKTRCYEIAERMDELHWAPDQKLPMLNRWVGMLKKLTGPIRQRGAKEALQELEEEGYMKLEVDGDVMELGWKDLNVYNSEDEG